MQFPHQLSLLSFTGKAMLFNILGLFFEFCQFVPKLGVTMVVTAVLATVTKAVVETAKIVGR
jgi:hypothetical protein